MLSSDWITLCHIIVILPDFMPWNSCTDFDYLKYMDFFPSNFCQTVFLYVMINCPFEGELKLPMSKKFLISFASPIQRTNTSR